jgi:hypothetical protein
MELGPNGAPRKGWADGCLAALCFCQKICSGGGGDVEWAHCRVSWH